MPWLDSSNGRFFASLGFLPAGQLLLKRIKLMDSLGTVHQLLWKFHSRTNRSLELSVVWLRLSLYTPEIITLEMYVVSSSIWVILLPSFLCVVLRFYLLLWPRTFAWLRLEEKRETFETSTPFPFAVVFLGFFFASSIQSSVIKRKVSLFYLKVRDFVNLPGECPIYTFLEEDNKVICWSCHWLRIVLSFLSEFPTGSFSPPAMSCGSNLFSLFSSRN